MTAYKYHVSTRTCLMLVLVNMFEVDYRRIRYLR